MVIEYYNINEREMCNLRELENKYADAVMLVITKAAFDGESMAELIVNGIPILVSVLELLLQWKEYRVKASDKKRIGCEQKPIENIAVGTARVVCKLSDGSSYEMEIENANIDAFRLFLNASGILGQESDVQ